MRRELAWYPGVHSNLNHIYDMATGKAICGSPARRKEETNGYRMSHKTYWLNADCLLCKSKANEFEAEEDDTCGGKYPFGWES